MPWSPPWLTPVGLDLDDPIAHPVYRPPVLESSFDPAGFMLAVVAVWPAATA